VENELIVVPVLITLIAFDKFFTLFVRYVLIEQSPGTPARPGIFLILLRLMRLIDVDKEQIPGIPELSLNNVE